jgi:6-phosphogluconolactonase
MGDDRVTHHEAAQRNDGPTLDSRPSTLDYGERGRVVVVRNAEALAQAAAETLVRAMTAAVAVRGRGTVVLSGGSTPKRMGELLAASPFREQAPWTEIEIFWGDERWVPLDSPESNAGEAKRIFLDHVPVEPARVNPFPTPDIVPDPAIAAEMYATQLRMVFGLAQDVPAFDLILLGMGDDGHTASLFPGAAPIYEQERLAVAYRVEKLNADRLTLTPPVLNNGREVVFLVGGDGKAATLARVLEGAENVDELPSQVVRPTSGTLTWLVDEAAAANLTGPGATDG